MENLTPIQMAVLSAIDTKPETAVQITEKLNRGGKITGFGVVASSLAVLAALKVINCVNYPDAGRKFLEYYK